MRTTKHRSIAFQVLLYVVLSVEGGQAIAQGKVSPGNLNGRMSVTQNGAMSYSIPIEVPPGIRKMPPICGYLTTARARMGALESDGVCLASRPSIERNGFKPLTA